MHYHEDIAGKNKLEGKMPQYSQCMGTIKSVLFHFVRFSHRRPITDSKPAIEENIFSFAFATKLLDPRYNEIKPVVKVDTETKIYDETTFIFPGFEGRVNCMLPLIQNLKRAIYCVQFPFERAPENISHTVKYVYPFIKERAEYAEVINVVAHSFGCLIALKVIALLESEGRKCRLCITDSSPYFLKTFCFNRFGDYYSKSYDQQFLIHLLNCLEIKNINQYNDIIEAPLEWKQKVELLSPVLSQYCSFNTENTKVFLNGLYNVIESIIFYDENFEKLECETTLIKPLTKIWADFPNDYQINRHFKKPVQILQTEGHHVSMLKNVKTADIINACFKI